MYRHMLKTNANVGTTPIISLKLNNLIKYYRDIFLLTFLSLPEKGNLKILHFNLLSSIKCILNWQKILSKKLYILFIFLSD